MTVTEQSIGFYSQVTRLPVDNVGVAVLTNDGDNGYFYKDIIKYRLIEEALGLESIDWNARFGNSFHFLPDS